MSSYKDYLEDENYGAAKHELEKLIASIGVIETLKDVNKTNVIELIFFVLERLKLHPEQKAAPVLVELIEKDYTEVIHGEDVIGAQRIKFDSVVLLEKITGIQCSPQEKESTTNVMDYPHPLPVFLAAVKQWIATKGL